ncbi:MAG: hypothetical protein K8F36_04635 [Melioribacteraceae bacterium]|nr:hypothetical protein [Melioribacteraceae bacterium]
MSDQAVHEMICAYASGCLDKENYIQFRKYLDEGGKLPKRELGETMNLMSLIPAMLEIEEPRPELKAEVAKKILTYQDEIKEKIKQIKKTRTGTVTSVEKTTVKKPSTEPVEEKTIKESEPEEKSDVNVEVPKEEKAAAEVHKKAAPKLHSAEIEEGDYVPDPTPMIKKPIGIWVWITLVILFLLLGALSVYHFFVVDNYESTINNLKREAIDTRAELREKESYLNSVNPLVEFMAKRQIKTIDIEGTDLAKNANGKLMVSVADNTALLDINNLPPIEQNLKFRLWIVSEGKSYPSIIFDYNQNTRYYFIENFPQVRFLDIELVRITAERNSINEIPEGNTYAFGAPLFN